MVTGFRARTSSTSRVYGAQTLVLLPNHTVVGGGTWAVQNPKHEITIDAPGGEVPITACENAGHGPFCYISDQYSGPETAAGIASQEDPGVANAYLGGYLLLSTPCWAVRTGDVHVGQT
jgi:hypothetical protein